MWNVAGFSHCWHFIDGDSQVAAMNLASREQMCLTERRQFANSLHCERGPQWILAVDHEGVKRDCRCAVSC